MRQLLRQIQYRQPTPREWERSAKLILVITKFSISIYWPANATQIVKLDSNYSFKILNIINSNRQILSSAADWRVAFHRAQAPITSKGSLTLQTNLTGNWNAIEMRLNEPIRFKLGNSKASPYFFPKFTHTLIPLFLLCGSKNQIWTPDLRLKDLNAYRRSQGCRFKFISINSISIISHDYAP